MPDEIIEPSSFDVMSAEPVKTRTKLDDFRAKYNGAYDKIDDATLAEALFNKHYANRMTRRDFDARMGIKPYMDDVGAAITAIGNAPARVEMGVQGARQYVDESVVERLSAGLLGDKPVTTQDITAGPYGADLVTWGIAQVDPTLSYLNEADRGAAYQDRLQKIADLLNTPEGRAKFLEPRMGDIEAAQARVQESQGRYEDLSEGLRPIDVAPNSPGYYGAQAIGSAAEMAPGLALSLLLKNPAPLMGQLAVTSGGQGYAEARGLNGGDGAILPPDVARDYAAMYAAAEAIPEAMPLAELLRPGVNVLTRMVRTGISEGVQEAFTELLQAGLEKGYLRPDMTWGEVEHRMKDAAVVGAIAGPMMGAVAHPVNEAVDATTEAAKTLFQTMFPQTARVAEPKPAEPTMLQRINKALTEQGFAPVPEPEPLTTPVQQGQEAPPAPGEAPPTPSEETFVPEGTTEEAAPVAVSGDWSPEAVLNHFEGFRERAYWDVNHWRVGYGSDTYVGDDGKVRPVTQDTVITREQADADRARRIEEFQTSIINEVGQEAWDALPEGAQSATTSMTYNYGNLPNDVAEAVRGGDLEQIAAAIRGHADDNDGVNAERREQEAQLVLGGGLPADGAGPVVEGTRAIPPEGTETTPQEEPAQSEEPTAVAAEPITTPVVAEAPEGRVATPSNPAPVETAADVETAAKDVNTEPTDAQKEAGNYQKGHVTIGGLNITIETPKGARRRGIGADGEEWEVDMPAHYGYIKRSEGADGEQVDVYIGENPSNNLVFVVDQLDADTGLFDEHKAILGVDNVEEAKLLYEAGFSDGRGGERIGNITGMTMPGFKRWLAEGDSSKPVGKVVQPNKNGSKERDLTAQPELGEMFGDPTNEHAEYAILSSTKEGRHKAGEPISGAWKWMLREGLATEGKKGALTLTEKGEKRLADVAERTGMARSDEEAEADEEYGEKGYPKGDPRNDPRPNGYRWQSRTTDDRKKAAAKVLPAIRQLFEEGTQEARDDVIEALATGKSATKVMDAWYAGFISGPIIDRGGDLNRDVRPTITLKDGTKATLGRDIHVYMDDAHVIFRNDNSVTPLLARALKPEVEAYVPKPESEKSADESRDDIERWIDRLASEGAMMERYRDTITKLREQLESKTGARPEQIEERIESAQFQIDRITRERPEEEARLREKYGEKIAAEILAEVEANVPGYLEHMREVGSDDALLNDVEFVRKRFARHAEAFADLIGKAETDKALIDYYNEEIGRHWSGGAGPASQRYDFRPNNANIDGKVYKGKTLAGLLREAFGGMNGESEPVAGKAPRARKGVSAGDVSRADASGETGDLFGPEGGRGREDRGSASPDDDGGRGAERDDARVAPDAGARDGGADGAAGDRAADRAVERAGLVAADYRIPDPQKIGAGGAVGKFEGNLKAIEIVKSLDGRLATPEEKDALSRYVGWGGLQQAFKRPDGSYADGWEARAKRLEEALTDEEYDTARQSTQYAHYTAPEVVEAIWNAVRRMGFTNGKVLEPSVGTGNFLGLRPQDLDPQFHAVEFDGITAAIAKALYGKARVLHQGFQDFTAPDGYYDLAIGNPPFGSQKLYDAKRPKISDFSLHNFFFAKSVDLLRGDGALAMVVTNSFLDAVVKDKARLYIADRVEFLGAIRLPNTAFQKNAGTEVTTDIIFLRRLNEGEEAKGEAWTKTEYVNDPAGGEQMPLNEYFVRHPEMMLGEMRREGTMYRGGTPALVAPEGQDIADALAAAIARLPSDVIKPRTNAVVERSREAQVDTRIKTGSMYIDENGDVSVNMGSIAGETRAEKADLTGTALERAKGLIGIRDVLLPLRGAQLADDPVMETHRAELNRLYDAFVKKHGPISSDANRRVFGDDPTWPQLASLEDNYDKGVSATVAKRTGETPRAPTATKAAIFSKRTQSPYKAPTSAKSANDALTASLSVLGKIDLAYMEGLYEKPADEILRELSGLVFEQPDGSLVTRDAYLSGNVKAKLAEAQKAAVKDKKYRENVEALEAVQPADVEAADIEVRPGAHWIPSKYVDQFLDHLIGGRGSHSFYARLNGQWTINLGQVSNAARIEYGTDRASIDRVVDGAFAQKAVQVYDDGPGDTKVLNQPATEAATEKAAKVAQAWHDWIFEDDARRRDLTRIYNDLFNTTVQREYDGSHLSLPGKVGNDIIRMRPHQLNGVWRMLQEPTTLLDHVVGAGKTFTMIAGAMEMRRMGFAKKPLLAVPNHLVGQWAEDFVKLYPGAKILAATKRDFEAGNRKKLFARMATGDWDAVIVGHSSLNRIELDREFQIEFLNEQIAELTAGIEEIKLAAGKDTRTVKQAEKQREALAERIKALADTGRKDDNLTFQELGVDALLLDEAHEFKNLFYITSQRGVMGLGNPTGSAKAMDLFMKVQAVMKRTGGRNIVFATGTPISNTMAEMFTIQRYLDYADLKGRGLTHFDAWSRQFADATPDWELSPTGTYKLVTRFRRFVNMPELMQRYLKFADVINRDDINRQLAAQGKKLPVPKVKGGKPTNIVVERSDAQAKLMGELVYRAEHMPKRAEKGADNMLKIMSDARKGALDMRLINPGLPDFPGSKANTMIGNALRLWRQWEKDRGAQLIFIDLSTPKGAKAKEAARIRDIVARAEAGDESAIEAMDKLSPDEIDALNSDFSVYDDVKEKLIERGVPEAEIAFIHDAGTELQKEELFGKVRSGRVRFLLGSTAKMGAGMNVQERLVALHHLDAPWRPSDLEQREGRIIRQGNALYDRDPEGFEVEVNRYASDQTLDSRMWQTIEQKANFIEQVRKGNGGRSIEDVGAESMNAAEMKAASSGNPDILLEMTLRKKVRTLENQKREHERDQSRVKDSINRIEASNEYLRGQIPKAEADAKIDTSGDFTGSVGGHVNGKAADGTVDKTYDKISEFGEAIFEEAAKVAENGRSDVSLGQMYGVTLWYRVDKLGRPYIATDTQMTHEASLEDSKPLAVMLGLRKAIRESADEAERMRAKIAAQEAELPALKAKLGPYAHNDEFAKIKGEYDTVVKRLRDPKAKGAAAVVEEQDGDVSAMREGPLVRIPKAFYDDHASGRDMPAPPIVRETKQHYWIDSTHEHFAELMSDARHYAGDGTDADRWVINAAKALMKAATDSDTSALAGADQPMPKWVANYAYKGVPVRAANNKAKIGSREVDLPDMDKPIRREGIRTRLEHIIGTRLYVGKIKGQARLGFYRKSNGEVRTRNYDDIEVMAHEMAHYLDYHYTHANRFASKALPGNIKDEIKQLSYTSDPQQYVREGFAEFVRLWLTQYSEAKRLAPMMTARFEAELSKDVVLRSRMDRLQEDMHKWFQQGALAQLRAKSGEEYTPAEQIIRFMHAYPAERMRQEMIDRIHGAKVVERTLGGGLADATRSAYKQFQMVNGAESVHESIVQDGTVQVGPDGASLVKNGMSLAQVFWPVAKKGWKEFDLLMDYFKARRASELRRQGRENLFTPQEIEAGLALAKNHPDFPMVFAQYQRFNERMLNFYVDMDLLTADQRAAFSEINANYVPFHRVSNLIEQGGRPQGAEGALRHRLKGGTANVKDIAENIVEGVFHNVKAALIARAKSTLYRQIMKHQDGALFATEIGTDSAKVKARIDEMAAHVATILGELGAGVTSNGVIVVQPGVSGVSYEVADITTILGKHPELLEFWQLGLPPKTDGDTMVDSAIINGERKYFEVREPLLVEMLTGMRGMTSGAILKALYRVKNLQTRTVTSMLQFLGPNAVRDTVSAAVLSKNKFIPIVDTLIGMGHVALNTPLYQELRRQGGGYGTRVEARTEETRARRTLDLPSRNMWDVAAKLLAGYDRFASAFEYGSRVGDFRRGIKASKTPLEAAWEAREITTDFAKIGRNEFWAKFIRTVPFMNAAIQGVDKTARELAEIDGRMTAPNLVKLSRGKASFLMKGAVITAMTLILWMLNNDDERYKQLTEDERARFWWIWVPGLDQPIKIPRPYDVGQIFASIPEAMLNLIKDRDGAAAAQQLAFIASQSIPLGDYPGILQPFIEVQMNKDWKGAPIVPQWMADMPPRYQFNERTPQMYVKLGELLGVSPLVAQHYAQGYLRYVEQYVADATDAMFWNEKEWGPRPFSKGGPVDYLTHQFTGRAVPYRTKWTEGYYDLKSRAAGMRQTLSALQSLAIKDKAPLDQFLMDRTNTKLVALDRVFNQIDKAFEDQNEVLMAITYDPSLTVDEKEAQIDAYYEQKNTALATAFKQIKDALDEAERGMAPAR